MLAALSLTVDSTADEVDLAPGDALCLTASGSCTLRAAIQEANANAGSDTIHLPAGTYALSITGAGEDAAASGDLDITEDLDILGAGSATTLLDAVAIDRVLHILSSTVKLSGVTVMNGLADDGGNIHNDGGTLTLVDVLVTSGTAVRGGGVFNFGGSVDLTSSTLSDNEALGASGPGHGGGIFDFAGTWTISESTISGNQAIGDVSAEAFGGGIFSEGGTWTITFSTLSDNMALGGAGSLASPAGGQARGGAIYFNIGPSFTIENSAIVNNEAVGGSAEAGGVGGDAFGGGLATAIAATVTTVNSTFSGNRAEGGDGPDLLSIGSGFGGGVFNDVSSAVTMVNVTVADNHALGGGGGAASSEAGGIANLDSFFLLNTIVATNTAPANADVAGVFVSHGHNLIGDAGTASGFTSTGDQVGTTASPLDPHLAPLDDNGGSTLTHALCTAAAVPHASCTMASSALDAADDDVLDPPQALTTDQRGSGFPRKNDLHVDIGAFEALGAVSTLGSLSGFVYHDANNNGLRDDGPTGINGVTITLTGVNDLGDPVSLTTVTATLGGEPGAYRFDDLRPSDAAGYKLTKISLPGFLDGKDTPGSAGGSSVTGMISGIVLGAGVDGTEYNFGELVGASLSGIVFHDVNNNGLRDDGPTGLCEPVTINLSGTDDRGDSVNRVTTTATSGILGSYSFSGLRPSDAAGYTITETQPACFLDGKDSIGTQGGLVANDMFTIVLHSGVVGEENNFGEILAASLSGYVYHDSDNNGSRAGDSGIVGAMITLTGTDDVGNSINISATTVTAGAYSFVGLRPSDATGYTLTEMQPVGYLDGTDTLGSLGGLLVNDSVSSIVLPQGESAIEYNFGEVLPVTIRGTKFTDLTGNGLTSDDTPLGSVTVELFLDSNGNKELDAGDGAPVHTTLTASGGDYSFTDLLPGRYFVREVTPSGRVRTEPATTDYHTIYAQSGRTHGGRDFANFVKCDTASVASYSYLINGTTSVTDLTGALSQGDSVTVHFTIGAGVSNLRLSLVSYTAQGPLPDPAGASHLQVFNSATGLFSTGSGMLTIEVPNSFFEVAFVCGAVIDHFGSADSNISYDDQMRLIDSDNGGTHPSSFNPASLSGFVYVDADDDGVRDSGEAGIAGVTVKLTGTNDLGIAVSLTKTTASAGNIGFYSFTGLRPGTYKITETQPSGFLDGKDTIGTQGGKVSNDMFSSIVLAEGVSGTNNNFGEAPSTCVSGRVYVDYNDDGIVDSTESGIAGVKITLTGKNDLNQSITVMTNTLSDGVYDFCGLRAGTYTITETQPAGFIDGIETRGKVDGIVKGTASNNKFTGIVLNAGSIAAGYNFGERPSGTTLKTKQTATISFWQSSRGEDLLAKLNGKSSSQALGNWLATTFPNLYGPSAGANDQTCKTNLQVASYFRSLATAPGSPKVEAQVLATALALYVTKTGLAGGSFATTHGFVVSSAGTATAKINVLNHGAAFGIADNSVLTLLGLLQKTDALTVNGVINGGNSALRKLTNQVYLAINETGDIS